MDLSTDIMIKDIKPMTVAYLNVKGHFSQIPESFGKLYGWVAQKDYKAVGPAIAVFHNIPGQVPDDQLSWELRTQLSGEAAEEEPDEDSPGVKNMGAITMATVIHKGAYEDVEPVYEALNKWIMSNNYEVCGPPEELYFNDPASTPTGEPLTEIRFPVREK
ncbi:GyrI-like domain-containing protein [Chloroflexota bacterium]